jgi:uncharacterized iron-regulated membrane protein
MAKRIWIQIHLWLGLSLGVLGIFIGISGSVLIYDHAIDAWLNPQRYAVSGAQASLPVGDYLKSAAQALEGRARPLNLRLPENESMPVVVFAREGRGSGPAGIVRLYLDPPTGRVLEVSAGGGFIGWVHSFHENLTLREYNGREIVGLVGIAMLISSLSGIYLWWPARGRLGASLLGARPGLTLSRNLHYLFGIYCALVLAMLSFTGIWLAYVDAGRAVVAVFSPLAPRNVQAPEPAEGGKPIPLEQAVKIAQDLYPGVPVAGIGLPTGPRGVYRVNLKTAGSTAPVSQAAVFVEPRSGDVLRNSGPATRSGGENFLVMQRLLHEGATLGPVGRALLFITGLLPALFVVTGSMMWLRQRRARIRPGGGNQ